MPTAYFSGPEFQHGSALRSRIENGLRDLYDLKFREGDAPDPELVESVDLLVSVGGDLADWWEMGFAHGASVPILVYRAERHILSLPSWLKEQAIGCCRTGSQLLEALQLLRPGLGSPNARTAGESIARVQAKYPC